MDLLQSITSGDESDTSTSSTVNLNSSQSLEYNVTLAILEARQLTGLDIDPYVQVHIGRETKKTKTVKNTNEPAFNEVVLVESMNL